jgi:hypothetical protein
MMVSGLLGLKSSGILDEHPNPRHREKCTDSSGARYRAHITPIRSTIRVLRGGDRQPAVTGQTATIECATLKSISFRRRTNIDGYQGLPMPSPPIFHQRIGH